MRNVPDDWGCYWKRCRECGTKYHASEGGCCYSSTANRPWLKDAGYELDGDTWKRRDYIATRVARKDHKDGKVKKGDRYSQWEYREIDDETGKAWSAVEKVVTRRRQHDSNSEAKRV